MCKLIPGWVKLSAAAALGAALLSIASFQVGKREGKSAAQIEAAKEAVNRLNNLEKNNAFSAICQIAIVAFFSCATAACQTAPATNGSGYQFVRFSDPQAARSHRRMKKRGLQSIQTIASAAKMLPAGYNGGGGNGNRISGCRHVGADPAPFRTAHDGVVNGCAFDRVWLGAPSSLADVQSASLYGLH